MMVRDAVLVYCAICLVGFGWYAQILCNVKLESNGVCDIVAWKCVMINLRECSWIEVWKWYENQMLLDTCNIRGCPWKGSGFVGKDWGARKKLAAYNS
jgi:hypothetical protein